MDEQVIAWKVMRERLAYRYLAALQDGDIEMVLDVLTKAERDAVLEEMLWQIHSVNLQEELDQDQRAAREQKAPVRSPEESMDTPHKPLQRRPRRTSQILQTLAAVVVVGALVGGFWLVLGGSHTARQGGKPQTAGCFVSTLVPQGQGDLSSVAALAEDDIWAVGEQTDGNNSTSMALIEHWNGRNWQSVANPGVDGRNSSLSSVTALSPTDIWAVGSMEQLSSASDASWQTLIEHWDGQGWHIVPSQNLMHQETNVLTGVAAVAANDIWAVGKVMQVFAPPKQPLRSQLLIEHWNGQNWQIIPEPDGATQSMLSELSGVVALASDNVWAVGSSEAGPLIVHWNGRRWSIMTSPLLDQTNSLTGISATGANDIWAVGDNGVVEHWDGKGWRVVVDNSQNDLRAVLALAPDNIWIAGNSHWALHDDTLIEHWDGKGWHVVPGPDPRPGQQWSNEWNALTSTSSGKVWLVGSQQAFQNIWQPLIAVSSCF